MKEAARGDRGRPYDGEDSMARGGCYGNRWGGGNVRAVARKRRTCLDDPSQHRTASRLKIKRQNPRAARGVEAAGGIGKLETEENRGGYKS